MAMDESNEDSEEISGSESPLDMEQLCAVFRAQLVACLQECAHGRTGLFSEAVSVAWPEAEQLRSLAVALHTMIAQLRLDIAAAAPVEQFLDLCSMHGESHPGEARLARQFLHLLDTGEALR